MDLSLPFSLRFNVHCSVAVPPFQLSFLSGIPGIVPMLHAVQPDILFGFLGGSRTRAVTGVMMMVMMMMMMMMLVMTATDSGKYAIAELT